MIHLSHRPPKPNYGSVKDPNQLQTNLVMGPSVMTNPDFMRTYLDHWKWILRFHDDTHIHNANYASIALVPKSLSTPMHIMCAYRWSALHHCYTRESALQKYFSSFQCETTNRKENNWKQHMLKTKTESHKWPSFSTLRTKQFIVISKLQDKNITWANSTRTGFIQSKFFLGLCRDV